MLKNKRLFEIFSFFISLFFLLSLSKEAVALGQKAVRDPSYYLHDLTAPNTALEEKEAVFKPEALMIKCGNPGRPPTGFVVIETGEFYPIEGEKVLRKIDFEDELLLKTSKEEADSIFSYAHEINLEKISFFSKQPEMDLCVIEYRKKDKFKTTRWIKHPYLRETEPPPEELLILFNMIQEKAVAKISEN